MYQNGAPPPAQTSFKFMVGVGWGRGVLQLAIFSRSTATRCKPSLLQTCAEMQQKQVIWNKDRPLFLWTYTAVGGGFSNIFLLDMKI